MTQDEKIVAVLSGCANVDILSDDDIVEINLRVFEALCKKLVYTETSQCFH